MARPGFRTPPRMTLRIAPPSPTRKSPCRTPTPPSASKPAPAPTAHFASSELKPGDYSLNATSSGFADFQMLRVTVEVGRITEVEIPFAVAGTQEIVEVRDEAPAVNTAAARFRQQHR